MKGTKRIVSCLLVAALLLVATADNFVNSLRAESNDTSVQEEMTDPSSEEQNEETSDDEENASETEDDEQPADQDETSGDEVNDATQPNEEDSSAENSTKEEAVQSSAAPKAVANIGQVDVSIMPSLLLKSDTTFTVSLNGQGVKADKTIVLKAEESEVLREGATFEGLAEGVYTLRVSAPGFAPYIQDIEVKQWAHTVKLSIGPVAGYTYADENHPGILLIGDVNADTLIDEADKDLLINALEGTTTASADVNKDNVVNLVDLDYFSKGYKAEQNGISAIETSIPAEALDVAAGTGTKVEGTLDDISKSENSIKLSRTDGHPISSAEPVEVEFDFTKSGTQFMPEGMVIGANNDNNITDAVVTIVYEEGGVDQTVNVPFGEGISFLMNARDAQVLQEGTGTISINFGSQIAVKKVTLRITGVKNNDLAEISRVEFLNDMEKRIPEPQMNIPEDLKVEAGNKQFTATWSPSLNVTGYEVSVTCDGVEEIISVKGPIAVVSSFNKDELENNTDYIVKVQAVNGAWRSGYGPSVTATPKATKKPDAPDNLSATGKYKSIDVRWKKMEDTDYYNLFYKESGEKSFKKIENIRSNSYTLTELKDKAPYEIYVTGVNELGESGPSLTTKVETADISPAEMPKYHLLNRAAEGKVSEHIISATIAKGAMKDSVLDTAANTALGTVDNNPASYLYVGSWDNGGFNPLGNNGITYEFDQPYDIQMFALQEVEVASLQYSYIQVRYWDENGQSHNVSGKTFIQPRRDANGRLYYMVTLPEKITAKKIQFGVARSLASGTVTYAEVYFYHYDSIFDDIMGLYEDDLHSVLKSGVTQTTIDGLRTRINTKDATCGEYHPDKEKLERELKTAEDILNSQLSEPTRVHNTITTNDVSRGFGGLNAWQPLGVTVAAGEQISVYVGHNTKKTGESTNLQLVATQYHAEASSMFKVIGTLKVGRNDITIPRLQTINVESGGALYVQYTGSNANDQYAVRVSGGSEVPVLDLYQVTDQTERLNRVKTYLQKLDTYVANMPSEHTKLHQNSDNKYVQYDYDQQNCVLGATDIMLDTMMFSLPAKQVVSGSGSGDIDARANKVLNSMKAMTEMMDLFYQHKGLNQNAADRIDRYPVGHQNIRYQRMFAGAFMYASGNHIGIEWGSTPGMMSGVPVVDNNGEYVSGQLYGWGIGHEIGHCINQGAYAVAEITNNYFAQLATSRKESDPVRFTYPNVYAKVTSNTKGRSSNVATQLAMYWQLHLAYDNVYNFTTFEKHDDQLANLFFARVDRYARTPSKAPAPNGIALTLSGGSDQILMRLSCASAQKNLLEFFERWGMVPDETTIAYAEQFAKETRAIYYVNDASRVYRLSNSGSSLNTDGTTSAVGNDSTAVVNASTQNQVDFTLTNTFANANDLLGYEIVRCITSNGDVEREVAGFTTTNTFSDHITTMNNRVITYEVYAIDKYLNRSAVKVLNPIKIEHDGSIDKSFWSVTTNNLEATDTPEVGNGDENTPCGPELEAPIMKVVDNDSATTYTGTASSDAEVILEFNRFHAITGFKYTVNSGTPIKDYEIYVREVDGTWSEAASGTFNSDPVQTVYFKKDGIDNIATYKTSAVKLVIKSPSSTISITELDVLGVTGDNVDFRRTDGGTAAIGKLKNDFVYDKEGHKIEAGSIIFTGSYKGNPAYNVVILYDQDGNIVGGLDTDGALVASQIILADVPNTGNIQDVSDGTWVYWLAPGTDISNLSEVRAELYRVDNALTNEGQRMVSDSLFEVVPKEADLPEIELSNNASK